MVAPQVSGFIQEVLAEDNQSVAAGQLLARIDDREYVAALAAARADLPWPRRSSSTPAPRWNAIRR